MFAQMLRIRLISPHGSHHGDFFPDSLLGLVCTEARTRGHDAKRLRLYYDGDDAEMDRGIRDRFIAWLEHEEPDVILFDRLFDLEPLARYRRLAPNVQVVLLTRGDSVSPMQGVDFVVGATPGQRRRGTRRTPTPGELVEASAALLDALAAAGDGAGPREIPGVSRMSADSIDFGPASATAPLPHPFTPVLDADTIAPGDAPRLERQTLFGNAGCPYSADPIGQAHFKGLTLPTDRPMARLGCAFCCMGGDYEARADEDVVEEIVAQAIWFTRGDPSLRELVLEDQAPLRYLGRVLERCAEEGVPALRWLFASRSDGLLRQDKLLDRALKVAASTGAELELYLTGFESFCDAELSRYNKGVDVETQLAAVERCRSLRREHPGRFGFTRARGHSLVLWSPWTTPEDIDESLANIRRHGLVELFDELGKNRLRLYEDLPLYWAARRDGALVEHWQAGDEGSGRAKGYNQERPWRFLDGRTRVVYALAEALRARLGAQTEVAQLRAIVEYARDTEVGARPDIVVNAVMADLDASCAWLDTMLARDRNEPRRGRQIDATPILFGGACNNGCRECPQRDVFSEGSLRMAAIAEAATHRRALLLAGREPTMDPEFHATLRAARDTGATVGLVSNGRRFAHGPFAMASIRAGLEAVSVRLFAANAAQADARARVDGGHAQALSGIETLVSTARVALELRVPLSRSSLDGYAEFASLGRGLGVPQLRTEISLDGLGLARLGRATEALDALATQCAREDVALEVAPVAAGEQLFQRMPAR